MKKRGVPTVRIGHITVTVRGNRVDYSGDQKTVERFVAELKKRLPNLRINFMSPCG